MQEVPPPAPAETVGDALNSLGVTLIHNLEIAIPLLVAGAVPVVLSWLKRRKRKIETAAVDFIKDQAVAAEMQHGQGHGKEKHAQVAERTRARFQTISAEHVDDLISTQGREAAHAYRDSLVPPEAN